MTVHADLLAITPTANAKNVVQTSGANLPQLMALADQHITDLKILLKQIVALHPSTGADASNFTALNSLLGELN